VGRCTYFFPTTTAMLQTLAIVLFIRLYISDPPCRCPLEPFAPSGRLPELAPSRANDMGGGSIHTLIARRGFGSLLLGQRNPQAFEFMARISGANCLNPNWFFPGQPSAFLGSHRGSSQPNYYLSTDSPNFPPLGFTQVPPWAVKCRPNPPPSSPHPPPRLTPSFPRPRIRLLLLYVPGRLHGKVPPLVLAKLTAAVS